MPELPEVETVRRGLIPTMAGATFTRIELRTRTLRFPFPRAFDKRLRGRRIADIHRYGKYLLFELDPCDCLLIHLGMTGTFGVHTDHNPVCPVKHDHVIFDLQPNVTVIFNDVRRFGFMTILKGGRNDWMNQTPLRHLGPDATTCTGDHLVVRLGASQRSIKPALLDQSIIAGLGNIYVSETLFRARLAPARLACTLRRTQFEHLATAMNAVLTEAIDKGGSSIRNYVRTDGRLGYFQNSFLVYRRAGQPCYLCATLIERQVICGRSGFFCPSCQT